MSKDSTISPVARSAKVGGLAPEPPMLQSPDYQTELERRSGCSDEEDFDDDTN